jgi:hypothetical protein
MEADVFVKSAKRVPLPTQAIKDIVSLEEKRHVLLDHNRFWYRDSNGFRDVHRNSDGLGHRDRHWVRNINRDLDWVRDRPLNCVRYWFLYRDRIRFRDVHGIGSVYGNCYRYLHRDRDMSFDSDRVRLGHGNRDFLSDSYCLDVSLVGHAELAAPTVQADAVVQVAVSVAQTQQSPLVLLLLLLLLLLLHHAAGCHGNNCQQNCAQL